MIETTNNNDVPATKQAEEVKRAARKALLGKYTYASRGRTDRPTHVTMATPVEFEDSDKAPEVRGYGYWKTGFSNGKGFSKTLYTYSTFRIVVGRNWKG